VATRTKAKPTTAAPKARRKPVPCLPFRCHFCGEVWKAWAPAERHSTVCPDLPPRAAGWIEVVLP
jgi:hypothetical protein